MVQRTKKPCATPGCTELVSSGNCAKHKRQRSKRWQQPAGVKALYDSKRWQNIRRQQLSAQPFCEQCLRSNIHTPATDVDHVQRHDGTVFTFFKGPFQSLCHACHSRKTASEVQFKPRGKGGKKVSVGGFPSGGGQRREKNSQCEES